MEKKYYKHKIENLININKIITIHYFEFLKDFTSDTESHNFYELVYAVKNNIICTKNGKDFILKQGSMILHKPNESHSLRADNKNNPDVFIISFMTKSEAIHILDDKVIELNDSLKKYIYLIIEESKKTFNIPFSDPSIIKMELKDDRPIGGLQIIKNIFELVLIEVMRETTKNNNNSIFLIRENYKGNLSGDIIKYLNDHINENIKIENISSYFHYNKSYLFKVFKKETGYTIINYYSLLKIEKAKYLLENTNKSIMAISNELSFDSPSYFSKLFKSIVHQTPNSYRKTKTKY